jgi:hypothetical protein
MWKIRRSANGRSAKLEANAGQVIDDLGLCEPYRLAQATAEPLNRT